MFTKILTPIQDTMTDHVVFERALGIAKQHQARLMLLNVLSAGASPALPNPSLYRYPLVTDELMKNYQKKWADEESLGLKMLKSLSEQAKAAGVSAEFSQNFGNVGRVICHMAENWEADLIVIRRPDKSKMDELFLGSISNYVLHHAICPVLSV